MRPFINSIVSFLSAIFTRDEASRQAGPDWMSEIEASGYDPYDDDFSDVEGFSEDPAIYYHLFVDGYYDQSYVAAGCAVDDAVEMLARDQYEQAYADRDKYTALAEKDGSVCVGTNSFGEKVVVSRDRIDRE